MTPEIANRVMHGSMYKEPQTKTECLKTACYECAYRNFLIPFDDGGNFETCKHYILMGEVENV